jgi:hypothetical protein
MAGYTRQETYTDGDVIQASHTNDEFDQLQSAFAATDGHAHDGSAGGGGPIAGLLNNTLTFGVVGTTADTVITFTSSSNTGILAWDVSADNFEFRDDILITTTEKLQFRNTAIYINSSESGQLDLVANGEIQIAAPTIDLNGAVDISGAFTLAGTTLAETISDTVGAMVTSNTETGITVSYDDADNTLDFVIGTLNQDTTGNAATATVLETARTIGGTSFNGSANIAVALSATATALATARTIHGVSFDGTANIDLSEVISDTVGAMVSSNTETGITVTYQDADNTIDFEIGAGAIVNSMLADDAVGADELASDAVVTASIVDANVTTAKIADANVTTAKIAADAITGAKIADDAINSEHYTDGSIDLAHMSVNSIDSDQYVDGSIDTAHIANLQITTGLIAADAITAAKIADDVVNSEHYAAGSIDTEHIADSQITVAKMAANSVDSDQYVDGSIDNAHLADDAVGADELAANAVVTASIVDANVTTAKIAADAITEAKIADNAVESEHINDNVISGQTELASGIADTDELLISDAGTIKRTDASVFKTYIGAADDATALAIALG